MMMARGVLCLDVITTGCDSLFSSASPSRIAVILGTHGLQFRCPGLRHTLLPLRSTWRLPEATESMRCIWLKQTGIGVGGRRSVEL